MAKQETAVEETRPALNVGMCFGICIIKPGKSRVYSIH